MNEKQQQLLFDKGITNVPSDALCSDNTLQECVGLVYDNSEHRVIQSPKKIRDITGTLLFVHKIPGGERENDIVLYGDSVKFGEFTFCPGNSDTKVAAIGKTLIINTSGVTYYALWKGTEYLSLGNRLPEVEMQFKMSEAQAEIYYDYDDSADKSRGEITYGTKTVGISSSESGVIDSHAEQLQGVDYWWHEIKKQDEFNEAMIGIVSAHLNDVKKAKRFCFPFFVRYAVLLYDGTYTCISNPILMMPTVHYNRDAYLSTEEMKHRDPNDHFDVWPATYNPYYSKLEYKITQNISHDWDDIVKGVGIFVSEEVRTFNLEGNWSLINPYSSEHGVATTLYETIDTLGPVRDYIEETGSTQNRLNYRYTTYIKPAQWTDAEFADRLKRTSVFYKIFEIEDASAVSSDWVDATNEIDSIALANLTTQEQLSKDDYYSHTIMSANIMKTYNSRLHLADISRSFFNGFNHFSNAIVQHLPTDTAKTYTFAVYISADDGERIVTKRAVSTFEDFAVWFYYPDPRAKRVEVYNETTGKMFTLALKEHESLNGAYAFHGLPYGSSVTETAYTGATPTPITYAERIVNRIFVSEVNNPWVFDSVGDVTVGNTKVKGMASQTMALGQEEHGIHPLTVFTEDGIYAISQNSEGVYMKADVFSREVCNNPKSIVETDGAVFFSSEKGLMVVVGSQVKCVSEQLSGKFTATNLGLYSQQTDSLPALNSAFTTFLKTAFIAYDYRDSLLWIFDGHKENGAVLGSRFCWIYSIKSGTFARFDFGSFVVTNVVNDYPDYLLQIENEIYSLLSRPNINFDNGTYSATLITRPMKLENALALKSIMQIKHIHDMNGTLTLRMFASNNLKNWVELHSLRGTPWKYYQFRYDFASLTATDRFAGTVLVTQERRTNKLR